MELEPEDAIFITFAFSIDNLPGVRFSTVFSCLFHVLLNMALSRTAAISIPISSEVQQMQQVRTTYPIIHLFSRKLDRVNAALNH